jgi:DNA modification methylase
MKAMPSESIDLIYLDPPFFSNRNYEVIWGDKGEVRSFEDRWAGGIENYIFWLKERVQQMHRLLKPTGSLYLHCDWHADAYIRVQILDEIFGYNNFRNEIIWKRTNTPKGSQYKNKQYGVATDKIFYYTKSNKYYFNDIIIRSKLDVEDIAQKYPKSDKKGLYYEYPILRSSSKGKRPNLVYEYKGFLPPDFGWVVNKEKLMEIDQRGDLGWRKNGQPYRKFRPNEDPGLIINNLWDDILRIQSNSNEAIGYPTQKPEALLDRIIKASSNEGDVVLDPFVGGGTTIVVADALNRKWIGIDQSVQAVKVSEMRFLKNRSVYGNSVVNSYVLKLHKYDIDRLNSMNAFEFERWIITQFDGEANIKQRSDGGIDGKTKDNTPIQVKQSKNIGRNVIDNFLSAVKRVDIRLYNKNINESEPVGYIIAFSFSKGAVEEVARLRNTEKIIIKLVRVDEIIEVSNKPNLVLDFTEKGQNEEGNVNIEITANAKSDSGIEFYSWDLDYKEETGFNAELYRETTGKIEYSFPPGEYHIACKVVDADGLENIEVVKLRVNGFVLRI